MELAFPGEIIYTENANEKSNNNYYELAKRLIDLHYDGPINYWSIYKFLLNDMFNEFPDNYFYPPRGKLRFVKPSFISDLQVKELARENRKLKPNQPSKEETTIKEQRKIQAAEKE
jgi:hypothetical protein